VSCEKTLLSFVDVRYRSWASCGPDVVPAFIRGLARLAVWAPSRAKAGRDACRAGRREGPELCPLALSLVAGGDLVQLRPHRCLAKQRAASRRPGGTNEEGRGLVPLHLSEELVSDPAGFFVGQLSEQRLQEGASVTANGGRPTSTPRNEIGNETASGLSTKWSLTWDKTYASLRVASRVYAASRGLSAA
jgi:hypothetical protein